jgi:hypothetical protein
VSVGEQRAAYAYEAKRAGRNTVRVFETEYEGLSTGTLQSALAPREKFR